MQLLKYSRRDNGIAFFFYIDYIYVLFLEEYSLLESQFFTFWVWGFEWIIIREVGLSPFNKQYVASPKVFCLCFHMKLGMTFPSLCPLLCSETKLFFKMPLMHIQFVLNLLPSDMFLSFVIAWTSLSAAVCILSRFLWKNGEPKCLKLASFLIQNVL